MAYSNGYADPGIDYGTGDNPPVIHNMPDLDPDHYAPPLSTPYAAQADCFPPQAPNQVSQVPEQYHQPPTQLQHHANYPPMQPNYPPMQNGAVPIHGVAPAQQPMVLSPQQMPAASYALPTPQRQPILVAPFKVSTENADEMFSHWKKGLWFSPSNFLEVVQKSPLRPMLVPYWSFDAYCSTQYNARMGFRLQPPTSSNSSSASRTNTTSQTAAVQYRYQTTCGSRLGEHKSLLSCASSTVDHKFFSPNVVGKFDIKKCVPTQSPDNLPPPQPWETAWKKRIEKKIKERERRDVETDIRHQHRCDTIDSTQVFVEFRRIEATLAYLPIYTTTYNYEGKSYRFLINGQTGKVHGERPYGMGSFTKGLKSLGSLFSRKDFPPCVLTGGEIGHQDGRSIFKEDAYFIVFPQSFSFLGRWSCGHIVLKNTSTEPVTLRSLARETGKTGAEVVLKPQEKSGFNYKGNWTIEIVDGDPNQINVEHCDRKVAGGDSNALKMADL